MTDRYFLKRLLCQLATPAARLLQLGGAWRRLWAFTRLQACLGRLHPSVVVLGAPEVHGTRRIRLGRDLYLYRDLYLETQQQGQIEIGDGVVLSRGVHLAAFSAIEIGAGSLLGEYVSVRDANHGYGPGLAPRHSSHRARPIRIGRHVWIGRGAAILAGVSIGDGAVIGANAVVTHDVAPGAIALGVPARALCRERRA